MAKIERSHSFVHAFLALPLLRSLDAYYPDFEHWYVNTVAPGVVLGQDTLLLASEGSQIVGVALGKRGPDETKLRCVRVVPALQHTGLGIRLIDRMLDELQCEKPHCTVAQELFHQYSRPFVARYGFSLTGVDKGSYRPGKLEYRFNG